MSECGAGVLAFLKSLAAGVSPMDYHTVRTKARDLLKELQNAMEQAGCQHDDTRCQEAMKAQAEAEAEEYLREKENRLR